MRVILSLTLLCALPLFAEHNVKIAGETAADRSSVVGKVHRMELSSTELEFDMSTGGEKVQVADNSVRPLITQLMMSAYTSGREVALSLDKDRNISRMEIERKVPQEHINSLKHDFQTFVEKFEIGEGPGWKEIDIKLIGLNGKRTRAPKIRENDPRKDYFITAIIEAFRSGKVIELRADSEGYLTRIELENHRGYRRE